MQFEPNRLQSNHRNALLLRLTSSKIRLVQQHFAKLRQAAVPILEFNLKWKWILRALCSAHHETSPHSMNQSCHPTKHHDQVAASWWAIYWSHTYLTEIPTISNPGEGRVGLSKDAEIIVTSGFRGGGLDLGVLGWVGGTRGEWGAVSPPIIPWLPPLLSLPPAAAICFLFLSPIGNNPPADCPKPRLHPSQSWLARHQKQSNAMSQDCFVLEVWGEWPSSHNLQSNSDNMICGRRQYHSCTCDWQSGCLPIIWQFVQF